MNTTNQKALKQLIFLGFIFVTGISVFLYYNYKSNNLTKEFLKNGGFRRIKDSKIVKLSAEYNVPNDIYDLVDLDTVGNLIVKPYGKSEIWLFNNNQLNSKIALPKIMKSASITKISKNSFQNNTIDLQCPNDRVIYSFNLLNKKLSNITFSDYVDKIVFVKNDEIVSFRSENSANFSKIHHTKITNGKEESLGKSDFMLHEMSEDGVLERYHKDLLYINFYNNKVYVIDSLLTKKQVFKTIDTITTKPATVSIKNKTITKFIHAPRVVNRIMAVSGDLLYINSLVKSDNDKDEDFNKNSLIDIYDLKQGGIYKKTIYIPKYNKEYFTDFIIKEKMLVLAYSDKIIKYEIK